MNIRRPILARLGAWIRMHRVISLLVAGSILIAIAAVTAFILVNQQPVYTPEPTPSAPAPKPKPVVYYSPLTGERIENESDKTAPVTAIMIENSPDARPQSGIKDAGVVYEAIAEGGITRFLALYQNKKPSLIGPVRSLRMYYVDWLAPYNPSVAHVGGSQNALNEIRNGNYRDLDEFFNSRTYWRASDRYAPHNVYTNFERLDALNQAKGYTSSNFSSFPRIDGAPAAEPNASSIAINFSSALYNTTYTYDKESNTYTRFLGGAAHTDRELGQIAPSVVIALRVTMQHVMEDGYREQINTIGTGSAVLFQNGTAEEVTWHKADRVSPLKITNSAGEDIPLIRGQTWIAAVPTSGGGSVSWQP
jgi:hypothetical protein